MTVVGTAFDNDEEWPSRPFASSSQSGKGERKVLHQGLKDLAVDALEMSKSRDLDSVVQSLRGAIVSFDMPEDMAGVLATLVVSAYDCARQTGDERALHLAYSCFSDEQLQRIMGLACSR